MMKFITFDPLHLIIGLLFLACLLPVFWRRKHSLPYLLFFSIFWIYLLALVQAVVFPIVINLEHGNAPFSPNINLVPFDFGDCSMLLLCLRGVIQNILLTIPFGFGINFLTAIKWRQVLWLAIGMGLLFETVQLIISLVFRSGFRAVDINDVIWNGTGLLLGYAMFRLFAWIYLRLGERLDLRHKWLLADIYHAALQTQSHDRP